MTARGKGAKAASGRRGKGTAESTRDADVRDEAETLARAGAPEAPSRSKDELSAWLEGFIRAPDFLEAYPYYAAVLAKLTPVADPSIKRMAVSLHEGRFFLHVNVEAFMTEPQYLRGILLHEVHHVVLGHLTDPKFDEVTEPELMDLAVEMSANEFVEEPLPSPIRWQSYAEAGLKAGQSTIERYDALCHFLREQGRRPRPKGDPAEVVDDHRFSADAHRAPGGFTQNVLTVADAVASVRDVPEPRGGEPLARRWLLAGRLAGSVVESLSGTTLTPEHFVDWRVAIQMFVARARAPVHTWARPSRRFPDRAFEVPGRTWALRRADAPRLLVAVDTSLSMTRPELEEIARQLVVLGEQAHLTIAECDAGIAMVYPFAGALERVTGRGGTDLRPVFAPAFLGAQKVDGVMYFTDGEGPFPEFAPPIPTLWVLTKPHRFLCPWGERAWLPARRVRA